MDAQNAAGGTQRITPATPQNPTPRTSPLDPHLSGQYRRWAAGGCGSLLLFVPPQPLRCGVAFVCWRSRVCNAAPRSAQPWGGEGGRGQMSQQPPPAWGGQMGWRGMGRGGGWRDRRMGREGGWRRPTCRSTARPSRPSHGLQTAAAALPADEAAGCPVPPRLWVSVGGPGGPMSPERLCSTSGRGAADGFLPCFLVQEEMLRWKGAARRAGGCFQPE